MAYTYSIDATVETSKNGTGGVVNMRASTSTSADLVEQIASGTKIKVETLSGDWLPAKHGTKTGYIMAKFIAESDVYKGSSSGGSTGGGSTGTGLSGIVLGGKLIFRRTVGGNSVTSIPNGTVLNVVDAPSSKDPNGEWYETTYLNHGTGYVKKAFVAVAGDVVKVTGTNVNVRNAANGSSVLYTISSPATATVQAVSTDWVKIKPSNKSAGWISATYVNKNSSGSTGGGSGTESGTFILGSSFWGTTTKLEVNFRAEPSTSAALVRKEDGSDGVHFYTFFTFSGTKWSLTQQREWLYFDNSSMRGYVMAKFIGTGGDSGANASISGSTVNFRTSPSTSASVITTLPKNKRVLIIDSIDGWYRVSCLEGTGWVSSSYVTKD